MNREDAKRIAPVMLSFGDGKRVEWKQKHLATWYEAQDPNFDGILEWRIKPEPLIRPWSNANEVPALPLQVRFKGSESNHRTAIVAANDTGIWLAGASMIMTHAEAYTELLQIDGSPCGITEAQP
jgi:hypothetical protein